MDYTIQMQQEKTKRSKIRHELIDKHPELAPEVFQLERADDEREKEYIFALTQNPPQRNPPNMQCIEYYRVSS